MSGRKFALPAWEISPEGKLQRREKRFNICKQLQRRQSKKPRPARKGEVALVESTHGHAKQ